ncbi:MAG TPA: hypothetical protein VMT69_01055 [Kineosporiaceae bacterium]|nr:hypothetical protein [Kineosporiaceae bacterium]
MGEPDSTTEAGTPGDPGPDEGPVLRSTRLPEASTAALRSSLADQAARTHELREALDRLRATLEAAPGASPPGPPPAPRPPQAGRRGSRRPAAGLAVLAIAVVLAAGVTIAVVRAGSEPRGVSTAAPASGTDTATRAPAGAGPGTPGASAFPAAPTTSAPAPVGSPAVLVTRPLPWPGGPVLQPSGLPVTGPGADAPGVELTAALDPDRRHVDVYERVLLRPGETSLRLAPAGLGSLPRALRGARPAVVDLQVEVDGRAVRPVAGRGGWQVTAPEGGAIGRVVLRYRLVGALVRQIPAPPGRATLILRPLAGGVVAATGDPVVVRIHDRRVGAVYCPAARHPTCASTTGRMHTAMVPPDAGAVVLAQVTLP